jgi:DNA replication protein DnaC/exonuclease III
MHNDDEDVWMTSLIERYIARPNTGEFETMCLATFASQFRISQSNSSTQADDEAQENYENDEHVKTYTLSNGLGTISRRSKSSIIRYARVHKEKNIEQYYYNLIRMYLPHRSLALNETDSYLQMFESNSNVILQNMTEFEKLTEELDEAWQHLQQGEYSEDAWADLAGNQETQRAEQLQEQEYLKQLQESCEEIDEDIPDLVQPLQGCSTSNNSTVPDVQSRQTAKLHHERLRTLNSQQSQLFYFIREWALKKEHNEDVDPFYIFLTGGAGTGKSHTIKCIFNEVNSLLTRQSNNPDNPVVLLLAYTGTAAYNIEGQTIHSALGINKGMSKYLSEDQANTLRCKLQDLQLLIIDEVSMVSKSLLNLIHLRLEQIKQPSSSSTSFGNISILAVGDFYQIPPVAAKPLTSSHTSLTELWDLFHIWELDEVVRQKGDINFIQLLNRVRVKDKGETLSSDDEKLLQSRIVDQSDKGYPLEAIHIAATHKQIDHYNTLMLQKLEQKHEMVHITAADVCTDSKTRKSFKRKEPLLTENTPLPAHFSVCKNSRVMLTSNLNVQDGLTNGAMGTVTDIIMGRLPLSQPEAILVKFDNENVGRQTRKQQAIPSGVDPLSTVVKVHTEVIQSKPLQITRYQFPFILAWAVTIHKVQGMTTDAAVISLKKIFKPGMAYVALSRVTSIHGLFLEKEDFTLDTIYCDPAVRKSISIMKPASTLSGWHQLIPSFMKCSSSEITILSHNIEGLLPHIQDFTNSQIFFRADIIALQETWLSQDSNFKNPMPNHTPVFVCRKDQHNTNDSEDGSYVRIKGGVGFLIHQDFEFHQIDTSACGIQCVAIFIPTENLSLYNIYRPPNSSLPEFCQKLQNLLMQAPSSRHIVMGDFNINLLKNNASGLSKVLAQYSQIINIPTTKGRTLLDHIYLKHVSAKESGVIPIYYSYHDVTYVQI